MKKTLVIVAHPDIENSVINKRWIEELSQYSDQFTVHHLYQQYPDGHIDVAKEQALVESHQNLVLQFPIYWFNCPPLLKQWLDDVLTYGWAYGSAGNQLKDKKITLAVSAGIKEKDYTADGRYHFSLKELCLPFELTARYVKADYQPMYVFYGMDTNPEEGETQPMRNEINQSAVDYVKYLLQIG
ncbi:NAD(P)H-dependent oxidoreductase [Acinetobacter haemolyticus]|uniref:NAD(P)H-dependent oxidoreductase n=1 Tax=Acinetobacter haemolyticus TaxID=29430 RepID=UPI000DE953E5|nr:NAD(P)H-dependent oxidoreductase [Acinetobacter haemolyticus]WHR58286.1 NAD(P)H-dependent oxidoreductase [Acinetobacter haemolyticus]